MLTTIKLFSPLYAQFYEKNEWGDLDYSPMDIGADELCDYQEEILEAIAGEHLDTEGDRGLAVYLDDMHLKSKRGEGYIDVALGLLCLMLVVALAVSFLPVFTAKQQLDIFATEIVRQAEIVGGTKVSSRINDLKAQTGLDSAIRWDCDYYSGKKVQLNGDIEVTLTETVDIGFLVFGSFQIEIRAKATGKSEVYYK